MILNGYSIYDRKAVQYHPPFWAVTDGAAIRMFSDLAGDVSTNIGRHPGDYVLFRIGSYDDSIGAVLPLSPLAHVADASALVKVEADLFADRHVGSPKPGDAINDLFVKKGAL